MDTVPSSWLTEYSTISLLTAQLVGTLSHTLPSLTVLIDMSSAMLEITPELRGELCVAHALGVWSAWSLGNYHRLFKLYENGHNLSKELMGLFLDRERKKALRIICRAYVTVSLCIYTFCMGNKAI